MVRWWKVIQRAVCGCLALSIVPACYVSQHGFKNNDN